MRRASSSSKTVQNVVQLESIFNKVLPSEVTCRIRCQATEKLNDF